MFRIRLRPTWISLIYNDSNHNPLQMIQMKSSYPTIVAVVLMMFAGVVDSQAQIRPRIGIDFMMGIPVDEFADNVSNIGFGGNLSGGIGLAPAPVMIGIDIGYLIYGYERRSEPFSTTIPDVTVDVETTNNIALAHVFLRIQPQTGALQPYAEALFGFKYLFTRTSVENQFSDEEIAASVNFDDFASSYGIGAGLDIQVFQGLNDNSRPYSIMINLGARYLLGSSAEYLEKGSTSQVDGELRFDVTRSRTDMILPQLGVTFLF